jgi:hypothetical protein
MDECADPPFPDPPSSMVNDSLILEGLEGEEEVRATQFGDF